MRARSPQPAARSVVLLLAFLTAALLAGCGGGGDKKTIPTAEGATLIRQLRKAEAAAGDPQQCPALFRAISAAQATVQSLPSSVSRGTRDSLTNGVKNLDDTARQECQNANTQTETTPTTPTVTTPTPTQPAPTTQTQPAPPTNTQTAPPTNTQTTPTQPPPGNGGAGPGNGGTPPGQQKKDGKGKDEKGPKK